MIFPKLALLILVFAQGVNSKKLEDSNIDCSDKDNHKHAMCMCRLPKNRDMPICQELFAETGDGDFTAEIINGEEVEPNVYPWFARATLGSGWAGCGGSLVTPEYVLTAAHCVDGRISSLENNGGYQIGALCSPYGPNSSDNCQQEVESFGIDKIIPHPAYSGSTLQYDFALVRLDGSSTITPVDMDPGNISPGYENLPLKQNLWPIGFGTTESGSVTSKLMHVNVNYVKQSQCNSNYNGDITDDMMCAADTNQDSCQGDSGGPLYDSDNDALVGVVSWGIGCALANYPGVYARVSHQIEWIKDEICKPGAHNEPRPEFCGSTGPTEPPTTAQPTPAPTPCIANDFKLTIITDNYPGETTWTLLNQCNNEQFAQGGPYNSQNTQFVEEGCIPDGEYTFTINDSYGDGVCCSYGSGSYALEYNGNVIKEGGAFGGSESMTFGSCGAPPTAVPTAAPTFAAPTTAFPTAAPTLAPTLAPTSAPTSAPTAAPTSVPTGDTAPPVVAPTGGGDWEPVYEDDFETDQGVFMGTNKRFDLFSYPDGDWSLRIRRTSQLKSTWITIRDYSQVSFKFWMYATGMEVGDNFFFKVRFNGEQEFTSIDEWVSGTDFDNQEWLQQATTIDVPAGKKRIQLLFKGDSDKGNDKVYIDQVLLEGKPN